MLSLAKNLRLKRRINRLFMLIENNRVQNEENLPMLQQNQDEKSVSSDSSFVTDFEDCSESSWQCDQQPPPEYHPQPPPEFQNWPEVNQLSDVSESYSYEECIGDCGYGDRPKDLPLFNGNLNVEEFGAWIKDVERYLKFYEIPEDKKVELVSSRFEQSAITWWEQIQNLSSLDRPPVLEWTEMKTMLIARFFPVDDDLYQDLPLLKKNYTVDEFCKWMSDLESFFQANEFSEDEQVELIASGLEGEGFPWQQFQNLSLKIYKNPIRKWTEMKKLLIAGLSKDDDRVLALPVFKKNFNLDEFCDWIERVESGFRDFEIPENEKVELVSYRLEEEALGWWQQIQNISRRIDKKPIQEWEEMKMMMMFKFVSPHDLSCLQSSDTDSLSKIN